MNFVCLFYAIIVFTSEVNTDEQTTIDTTEKSEVISKEGVFLTKLQDKEQVTKWNDILADILANAVMKVANNPQKEETNGTIDHDGFLKTLLSKTLYIYKYYIHDKFVPVSDKVQIVEPEEWAGDPKDEVEVFAINKEERCTACNDTSNDCPKGMRKNADGKCIRMASPSIISVPSHCPKGYRKDRWGYCRRVMFNF